MDDYEEWKSIYKWKNLKLEPYGERTILKNKMQSIPNCYWELVMNVRKYKGRKQRWSQLKKDDS